MAKEYKSKALEKKLKDNEACKHCGSKKHKSSEHKAEPKAEEENEEE